MSSESYDLEKSIYGSPDVVHELRDCDWMMAPHVVMNLDLALERLVAQPLQCKNVFHQRIFFTRMSGNATDHDTDVDYRSLTKLCEFLRIDKTIASASRTSLKGNAEFPIRTLEEDGHLQFCLSYQPSSILSGYRGPYRLGYHGAHNRQASIEHAWRLRGSPNRDMRGRGIDDEEATFYPCVGHDPARGNVVALQQMKEVLLGRTTVETSRYVSVDEKGLHRKGQKVRKMCPVWSALLTKVWFMACREMLVWGR